MSFDSEYGTSVSAAPWITALSLNSEFKLGVAGKGLRQQRGGNQDCGQIGSAGNRRSAV